MALKVSCADIWVGAVKDKAGALSKKLEALAEAGAQIEFILARRSGGKKKGKGVVFLTPLSGAKQLKVAKKVGLRKSKSVVALRVEGPDKPGAGAKVTRALADEGINLRGFSGAVIGRRFVLNIALDSAKDAKKAVALLSALK